MDQLNSDDCRAIISSTATKWFRCDDCGATFATVNTSTQHRRNAHPRRLRCGIEDCEAAFPTSTDLNKHICEMHPEPVLPVSPDSLFINSTASDYLAQPVSPPVARRRLHHVPEGFSLVDLHSRIELGPRGRGIGSPPRSIPDDTGASLFGENTPESATPHNSETDVSACDEAGPTKKRKASFPNRYSNDRITRARLAESTPEYEVKQSKLHTGQQKALEWLGETSKLTFEQIFETLIGRWGGVKPTHQGSCVLVPEDWRVLSPSNLVDVDDARLFPDRQAYRLTYKYSDHCTMFTRAVAWFRGGQWPRTGVQLDNFLGCGPFKPMEASHLCHQDHCIVHLTYEAADINSERRHCASWAQSLRQAGQDIPESCSKHDPPCLLQHASLLLAEAYQIQFDILSKATGPTLNLKTDKPTSHPYPTFETGVPLSWGMSNAAIKVEPSDLLHVAPSPTRGLRPDLVCTMCTKVKGYSTIIGYWAHIYHKHTETEPLIRLEEIRRTAVLWRTYLQRSPVAGRWRTTMEKLAETELDTFSWEHVAAWNLR